MSDDDTYVTSKAEAELLAYDRLNPYLWNLRQRVESRITGEWVNGEKIEIIIKDTNELAVADRLADEYRNAGWTVTVGGKRKDSAMQWFTLE